MHHLTKDPSKFIVGTKTPSSPPFELNEFQMTPYLDYRSETLSLTSKVAGESLTHHATRNRDILSGVGRTTFRHYPV